MTSHLTHSAYRPSICFYTAEILMGLWFLHGKGIVYRDLKLDNVMIASDGHVKIADFGMCKEKMPYGTYTTTFCGTPDYLAPEICEGWLPETSTVSRDLKYTSAVDFWTLGVVVYEMAMNMSPFEGESEDELFASILNDDIVVEKFVSKPLRRFILGLMMRNPLDRLGCSRTGEEDCKHHAFFRDMVQSTSTHCSFLLLVVFGGQLEDNGGDATALP